MSTKHTSTVYLQNNTGYEITLKLQHEYGSGEVTTKTWHHVPNGAKTPTPMTVHYETGLDTAFTYEYWWIRFQINDGSDRGVYKVDKKECFQTSDDDGKEHVFTVSLTNFHIALVGDSCDEGITKSDIQ